MNRNIALRSISTLAVTGGLVLGGAAAAQAGEHSHDSSSDRTSHTKTEAGAPISIGGLVLGSSNEQSSSSKDAQNDEGDRDARSSASQDADESQGSSYLELKPITIDPTFGQEQQSSSSDDESSRGHDRGDRADDVTRHEEHTSKGSTKAGAPASFDGFSYRAEQHAADASRSASNRDGDHADEGSQRSESSASTSHSTQDFDLGKFLFGPGFSQDSEDHGSVSEHVSR